MTKEEVSHGIRDVETEEENHHSRGKKMSGHEGDGEDLLQFFFHNSEDVLKHEETSKKSSGVAMENYSKL